MTEGIISQTNSPDPDRALVSQGYESARRAIERRLETASTDEIPRLVEALGQLQRRDDDREDRRLARSDEHRDRQLMRGLLVALLVVGISLLFVGPETAHTAGLVLLGTALPLLARTWITGRQGTPSTKRGKGDSHDEDQ